MDKKLKYLLLSMLVFWGAAMVWACVWLVRYLSRAEADGWTEIMFGGSAFLFGVLGAMMLTMAGFLFFVETD